MRTYQFQSQYHGLPLDGVGLPQEYAVPLILGFMQEAILDELERGLPRPASFILWTKGADKVTFFSTVAGNRRLAAANANHVAEPGGPALPACPSPSKQ